MNILFLLLIPVFSILNAYRGGGFFAEQSRKIVKIHPRFQVTIVIFLILYFISSTYMAFAFAISYLLSNLTSWGRWYDLDRMPEEPKRGSFLEKYIDMLPNDHYRFFVRHLIWIMPAVILISPLFLAMPFIIVACYEVAWRKYGNYDAIRPAEAAVGAFWGLYAAYFCMI